MTGSRQDRSNGRSHPYLAGNFAPIHCVRPLTACTYTGSIPEELAGGQYIRNGGNPVANGDLGRDAHWFDGDGMLSGVAFQRSQEKAGGLQPQFVNQYILTDVYLSSITSPRLRTPILPSITTLVNPLSSLIAITLRILRTLFLVALSHLPGSQYAIKKISVANTSLLYHDGRALATCESGPPMRIALPGLETVGWFNGRRAEGERRAVEENGFGDQDLLGFMREWTTAHPRVDPATSELVLFHSSFAAPYVQYSILSPDAGSLKSHAEDSKQFLNQPVPGISSAKMMHDFGVSKSHTVIMDLPLSLDPLNLVKNKPVVSYDPTSRSRFGVFPRYRTEDIRWFETNACCIFHTANTWDTTQTNPFTGIQETTGVNMLACRLTSASLVYSAGDIAAPVPIQPIPAGQGEEEQCRLYYYHFAISPPLVPVDAPYTAAQNVIVHQWALSAIPFEFPTLRDSTSMSSAKYIYGCSVSDSTFGAALGRAVKIDSLVKADVETLIRRGEENPPTPISGCVDTRDVRQIAASEDPNDPIKLFKMPDGFFAQESRFVPRMDGSSEDDGWLLTYVFDESQLALNGECAGDAKSELWIIDARNMRDVVAKVYLPQRVPYGLHGNWFSEAEVQGQRPVETYRKASLPTGKPSAVSPVWTMWMMVREAVERILA